MRFYGMLSLADTLDEISRFSQTNNLAYAGAKNICFCRENQKFYESNGGNYFECSEINSMLKSPEPIKAVPIETKPTAPNATVVTPINHTIIVGEQEMDLQTFANETVDTLRVLSEFKTRFENIFNNGGNK